MSLKSLFLVAVISATTCPLAFGSEFSGIVAFGDSLSDAGNASIATAGVYPGPGYATNGPFGYFTNPQYGSGPSGLWIDQLASKLGVADPLPSLAGGSNFAVASAQSGSANPQDMEDQIALYLALNGHASTSDLYTFWGGANDLFHRLNPVTAANNIAGEIQTLASAGGKDFVWLNLPSLGETPGLIGTSLATQADLASAVFDAQWALDLSMLQRNGVHVTGVDVNSLFNDVVSDPAAYGFTNVTTACDTVAGCDPNTYLYWDTEHPTTEADSLVADLAYNDLNPTPEPPSVILLSLGLATLTLFRTRLRFV